MDEMTYARAGVDIEREDKAVKALAEQLRGTLKFREGKVGESLLKHGHFASLVSLGTERALALSADGVGTKILVAQAMEKYDTVGIDLVAMNANDVICVGAEPFALVDYIAMEEPSEWVIEEIGRGLARGAEMAQVSIVGGETATLPEMVRGFDLAGLILGVVEKSRIIKGDKVSPGDAVIGLESSGIHSNGLTLARKLVFSHYHPDDDIFPGRKAGEELLEPTKVYVPEVLDCLNRLEIRGLVNITGGGLRNLARITEHGFRLDNLPELHRIFSLIQELGKVSEKEMFKTFNMGVGFCILAREEIAGEIVKLCQKHGTRAQVIGSVVEEKGVAVGERGFTI